MPGGSGAHAHDDAATARGDTGDTEFTDAQDGGTSGFVDRVAIRLPPFWPDDPDVWFGQAEAQFIVSGIKDDATKFYCVIAQLDHRYAKEIKGLIKNPPPVNKYQKLKSELIKCLSISRHQQITQVLSNEELGDRKASQFLRHLTATADGGVSDEFLRSIWMKRLPAHVQPILISQTSSTLEQLGELADKIIEATSSAPPFQVASTCATNATSGGGYDGLLRRIDELTRAQLELSNQVAQMNLNQGRQGRARRPDFQRSRSRGNTRSKSRGRSRSRVPGMCWYHSIFGEKAKKCITPCNYFPVKASGSQ